MTASGHEQANSLRGKIVPKATIRPILKTKPLAPVNRKPSTILGHEANNVLQVHPHSDRGE